MKNFMGTENRTLEFWQMNNISGRNGSGKTSIKEAIGFALFGKIYWQDKLLDGAIYNGSDNMIVILELEYKGNKYIIERSRGSATTIKINWKSTSQDSLKFLFDSYETFVSAFAVGDFMKLEEEDRYEILSSLFPDTREAIYEKIVGKELAEKYPFNNTELKNITAQIKTIEGSAENVRARKTLISEQINTLRSLPAPTTDVTEDIIQIRRQALADHETTRPKMNSEVKTSTPEIALIKGELAANKVRLRQHEASKPSREKLDELKTKYDMALQEITAVGATGACPTCMRPYKEAELEVKKQIAQEKADGLLAEAKLIRADYNAELMGWEAELTNITEAIRKGEESLEVMQNNLLASQSGDVDYFNTQFETWEARRKELETELWEVSNRWREFIVRKTDYDANADKIAKLQKELEELDKSLGNSDLLDLEKIKEALGPKGVEFQEMQSKLAGILEYFPKGTDIELLRKNKTNDEYKKVFSVTVDGVNYNWLSKGMKKVFDIYVAELIGNKLGIDCMCIDDNESLTSACQLTNQWKQVITLTARDEDFSCEVIPYSK